MSDYHLLGLVLLPVVGIVAAFLIIFLCKSMDLCLPSGPGPYAHLASDTQRRSSRSERRRQKECEAGEMESGGAGSLTAAMAAKAPMPPVGLVDPTKLVRILNRDQS